MRIAAKRLRAILAITHPCFGPDAAAAVKSVKEVRVFLDELLARREREFAAFRELWQGRERNEFRGRVASALCSRSGGDGPATIDPQ